MDHYAANLGEKFDLRKKLVVLHTCAVFSCPLADEDWGVLCPQ